LASHQSAPSCGAWPRWGGGRGAGRTWRRRSRHRGTASGGAGGCGSPPRRSRRARPRRRATCRAVAQLPPLSVPPSGDAWHPLAASRIPGTAKETRGAEIPRGNRAAPGRRRQERRRDEMRGRGAAIGGSWRRDAEQGAARRSQKERRRIAWRVEGAGADIGRCSRDGSEV
jgi:hypothetical protein